MKIDAHHHLWNLDEVHYPWLMASGEKRFFGDPTPIQRNYLVDEFRRDASACGIEASVHVQVGAGDSLAEARWVQQVADENPGWPAAQVAFCDLTAANRDRQLESLARLPSVRGIRQIVGRSSAEDSATGTNTLLTDPAFREGLHIAAEMGFSFDLQLTPSLMAATADLFSRLDGLKVALCHASSPDDWSADGLNSWGKSLARLAALPHLSCKLSGLGMFNHGWAVADFRPIIETCLEHFGPSRCMFGSNFPVDSLSASYARTVEAHLAIIPPADHPAVFEETAREFYGIRRLPPCTSPDNADAAGAP